MIRHRETNELLGAHLIGHNATECIAAATALLQQKVSLRDVAKRSGHIPRSAKPSRKPRKTHSASVCICRRGKCCGSPRPSLSQSSFAMGKKVTDALDALRGLGTPAEIRASPIAATARRLRPP